MKLAKAQRTFTLTTRTERGLHDPDNVIRPYHESIKLCRWFYRYDPIASTVVNRMAEIAATQLRNRRKSLLNNGSVADEEYKVYQAVAKLLQPVIASLMISYLVDGMAIPQYELTRMMGSRVSNNLGRTRYYFPHAVWMRDPDTIRLYRTVKGYGRRALVEIPADDINFILTRGQRSDGVMDTEAYEQLLQEFPEYVQRILDGNTTFPVDDYIIFRKLLPQNDYPLPFLEAALEPLDHKRYLKIMDRAIASRAIEAFRHIKVGSDEYPADDDDIEAAQDALQQQSSVERVYNLFTNHTISIEWVTPPFDVLLDERKYNAANADIFFAVGFPRILVVGETEKSNAADNKIASLGVLSTLKEIQTDVLQWVEHLYKKIAEANGFTRIPEPYFTAISLADVTSLIQYAKDMLDRGVISQDTAATFYGTDFETENDQREYEQVNAVELPEENTPIETQVLENPEDITR